MSAPRQPVRYEVTGSVARIMLDRPERRNALDAATIAALTEAFERAGADESVRVVALSGAGPDFSAGADLDELAARADAGVVENLADAEGLVRLILTIRDTPKPVVALVRGRALAGGCGLATACDLVLAAESASFGYSEVRIGFVPAIVMTLLRRSAPEKKAFELIATGESIGAAEAETLGLVNRVFADEAFDVAVEGFLRALAERSPSALRLAKRQLYGQDTLSFESGLRSGAAINVLARMTDDARAGMARFVDARGSRGTQR